MVVSSKVAAWDNWQLAEDCTERNANGSVISVI